MSYHIIQPPFTLKFREMPKKELKAYNTWFLSIMQERINELARTVKSSPGFENWIPDHSPSSLELLGIWLARHIEVRSRSNEELERIKALLPFPMDVSNEQLTNKTFSLAIDAGMYFAHVFCPYIQMLNGTNFWAVRILLIMASLFWSVLVVCLLIQWEHWLRLRTVLLLGKNRK